MRRSVYTIIFVIPVKRVYNTVSLIFAKNANGINVRRGICGGFRTEPMSASIFARFVPRRTHRCSPYRNGKETFSRRLSVENVPNKY